MDVLELRRFRAAASRLGALDRDAGPVHIPAPRLPAAWS